MRNLTKQRFIIMILCFVAFFGFSRPAIRVSMSFLGTTRTVSLSLATVFEGFENPLNKLNSGQSDLSDMVGGDDIIGNVMGRVILSVALYFITSVLVLLIYIVTVMGKLNKTKMVVLALAFSLMILAGFVILTVPGIIANTLADRMGFLALFIEVTELLNIGLGFGYWIILSALAGMLLIDVYMIIKSYGLGENTEDPGSKLVTSTSVADGFT